MSSAETTDLPVKSASNLPAALDKEKKSADSIPAIELLETILHAYYASQDKLESLLTEEKLSLAEGHYVQLMLIKEKEERQAEQKLQKEAENGNLLRDERLASHEDIHKAKEPILLEKLFERAQEDKKDPKRQLILGRAGIGKSTLCQYIAYSWSKKREAVQESKEAKEPINASQQRLWANEYDAIFWIKLRDLVRYKGGNKRAQILLWLIHDCWRQDKDEELTEQQIMAYLKAHKGKFLFLLDGFDELSSHLKYADGKKDRGEKTPYAEILDTLLAEDQWLVTSRPDFVQPLIKSGKVDRTLENIGFNNGQIERYVRHFFNHYQRSAAPLLAYLKRSPGIWGIAHIPINLSLICSLWYQDTSKNRGDAKRSKDESLEGIQTITKLYERMAAVLLDRSFEKQTLSFSSDSSLAKEERNALLLPFFRQLAFQTLQAGKGLVIEAKVMNEVFKTVWEQQRAETVKGFLQLIGVQGSVSVSPQGTLIININGQGILTPEGLHKLREELFHKIRKVGFLKPTGDTLHESEDKRDYYFLHLTFQEYFAALYLAEGFGAILGSKHYSEAVDCLKQYKYAPSYQMIWRFVAGITQEFRKKDAEPSVRVFWTIFNAPEQRDLIGYQELQLVSHLLAEAECEEPWIDCQEANVRELQHYLTLSIKVASDSDFLMSIMRSLPRKIAKEVFSVCLKMLQDIKAAWYRPSGVNVITRDRYNAYVKVLGNLTHQMSQEVNEAFSICLVKLEEDLGVSKDGLVDAVGELVPWLSEAQINEIFFLCLTIFQNVYGHVTNRYPAVNILAKLVPYISKTQKHEDAVWSALSEVLSSPDGMRLLDRRHYQAFAVVIRELGIKPVKAQIAKELRLEGSEKITVQIDDVFSFFIDISANPSKGVGARMTSVCVACELAPQVKKTKINEALSVFINMLQDKKVSKENQSVASFGLEIFSPLLTKTEAEKAFSVCLDMLLNLKTSNRYNGGINERALCKLAPLVSTELIDKAFYLWWAILQHCELSMEIFFEVFSEFASLASEKLIMVAFWHHIEMLKQRYKERQIGNFAFVLWRLAPRVPEAQLIEIFSVCFFILQDKEAGEAQQGILFILCRLVPLLSQTRAVEIFLRYVQTLHAMEENKGGIMMVIILGELASKLPKTEWRKVFSTSICQDILGNVLEAITLIQKHESEHEEIQEKIDTAAFAFLMKKRKSSTDKLTYPLALTDEALGDFPFFSIRLLCIGLKFLNEEALCAVCIYAQNNGIVLLYKPEHNTLVMLQAGKPEKSILLPSEHPKAALILLMKVFKQQAAELSFSTSFYEAYLPKISEETAGDSKPSVGDRPSQAPSQLENPAVAALAASLMQGLGTAPEEPGFQAEEPMADIDGPIFHFG